MQLIKGLAALAVAALVPAAPLDSRTSKLASSEPSFVSLDPQILPGGASTAPGSEPQQTPTQEPVFPGVSEQEASSQKSRPANPRPSTTLPVIIVPPSAGAPPGATPSIFTPTPDMPAATPSPGGNNTNNNNGGGNLNVDLVPSFGVIPNTNPNARQQGSCDGFTGTEIVLIPCSCPPDRDVYLSALRKAVAAGRFLDEPVSFSNDEADNSPATNRARATSMLVVLQSLTGVKGVGCPAASAPNFLEMQKSGVRINGTFIAGVAV